MDIKPVVLDGGIGIILQTGPTINTECTYK